MRLTESEISISDSGEETHRVDGSEGGLFLFALGQVNEDEFMRDVSSVSEDRDGSGWLGERVAIYLQHHLYTTRVEERDTRDKEGYMVGVT